MPLLPGGTAVDMAPVDPDAAADQLGRFLGALHQPAPPDHPLNAVRGVPLAARDAPTVKRIAQLAATIDAPAVTRCWRDALAVPAWSNNPVWLHGDLHRANVLVQNGLLSAVIDFGDITGGDPASDLAWAWMLLSVFEHATIRAG